MTALAKIRIGLTGHVCLLFGHWFDDNAGAPEKGIELAAAAFSGLRLDNDRHFNIVGGRDPAGRAGSIAADAREACRPENGPAVNGG